MSPAVLISRHVPVHELCDYLNVRRCCRHLQYGQAATLVLRRIVLSVYRFGYSKPRDQFVEASFKAQRELKRSEASCGASSRCVEPECKVTWPVLPRIAEKLQIQNHMPAPDTWRALQKASPVSELWLQHARTEPRQLPTALASAASWRTSSSGFCLTVGRKGELHSEVPLIRAKPQKRSHVLH